MPVIFQVFSYSFHNFLKMIRILVLLVITVFANRSKGQIKAAVRKSTFSKQTTAAVKKAAKVPKEVAHENKKAVAIRKAIKKKMDDAKKAAKIAENPEKIAASKPKKDAKKKAAKPKAKKATKKTKIAKKKAAMPKAKKATKKTKIAKNKAAKAKKATEKTGKRCTLSFSS